MSDWLHPMLLALTLIDLAFVGVTGVVPGVALAPLLVLACSAPLLRRLQRHRLYRAAWNTGVLVVFAMLVQHASTTGLLHMLEDGLLLAVLCQVHLLNNVGARQRPDLVFFNSFLIAFVTSFFAASFEWSLLFVVHAVVFVPALELNVLARRGAAVDGALARALWRDSLPRTAMIGLATALAFVFLPRDFQHEGWLGDALQQHAGLDTGLDQVIRLDDERRIRLDDTVVMRVAASPDVTLAVPSHWRCTAYSTFDGRSWQPQDAGMLGSRFATDPRWDLRTDGRWQRALPPLTGSLEVELTDPTTRHLPLPLNACRLVPRDAAGLLLDPKSWAGFAFFRVDDTPTRTIAYTVRTSAAAPSRRMTERTRDLFLRLPQRGIVETAGHIAERLRKDLPADADPETVARASTEWLRGNRRYQLPGGQGFAGSIAAFAIGSGAGHCEYFATVLAVLLRHQGVPCRLVGGYLAQERADDGAVIVRRRHAHAWVEALMPDGSWLTLDATPAAASDPANTGDPTWWRSITGGLSACWDRIVGFDDDGRTALVGALAALPGHASRFVAAYPLGSLGLLVLPFALVCARRRQRRPPPAVLSLVGAARALGLELQAGETPRELLGRARAAAASHERVAALAAAVARHERIRYRGAGEANHEA